MKYPITSIFRSLQGEGHFYGYPTTFIRFAGCSVLNCAIRAECDEAPWKAAATMDAREIVQAVRRESPAGIVCLTGGEPSDHNLIPIVDALRSAGFSIHIETSGARSLEGMPFEWKTVSPKTPDFVERTGNVLKLVVRPGMTWHQIWDLCEGTAFFHRYLQPLTFPDGSTNLDEVRRLLLSWDNYKGQWALSTQQHKTWGLP
jgi:organic radical activating enzyme